MSLSLYGKSFTARFYLDYTNNAGNPATKLIASTILSEGSFYTLNTLANPFTYPNIPTANGYYMALNGTIFGVPAGALQAANPVDSIIYRFNHLTVAGVPFFYTAAPLFVFIEMKVYSGGSQYSQYNFNFPPSISFPLGGAFSSFISSVYGGPLTSSDYRFCYIGDNGAPTQVGLSWSVIGSTLVLYLNHFSRAGGGNKLLEDLNATKFKITFIPEGYYDLGGANYPNLNVSDTFSVHIASPQGPDYADITSGTVKLDSTTYSDTVTFPAYLNGDYYIYVKGQAIVATWSANPISFTAGEIHSYDFTTGIDKAYSIPGFPYPSMIQKGSKWCVYSGDVDQDELIGNVDLTMIDNDAFVTLEVHGPTDLDGDALVGNVDLTICDNHAFWVVESQSPRKVGGMAYKYLHKPVLKRANSIQK